ncbi:MAG TPA: PfkB family carbohydrate kinase, partial [Halanaerobiales bacterium]|nr:PfkB family carbohydrate kinase [Halanaerobiales bacterium]
TPCIAVKLGNEGSKMMIHEDFKSKYGIEYTAREYFSASPVHVIPVDTTGAGDAFNAGFIYSFLNNEKPQKWLETGNSLAGKVIAEKGAISHYIRS